MSAETQLVPEEKSAEQPQSDEPLSPDKSLVPVNDPSNTPSNGNTLFSWLLKMFIRRRGDDEIREDLADALSDDDGLARGFSIAERNMLTSILRLKDTRIEDLMVPRADIESVNEDISLAELLKVFEESGHSRMPVHGETLDDPKGIIHIRDVVAYITKTSALSKTETSRRRKELPGNLDLKKVALSKPISALKLLREVMFVPPSMGARELMNRMQADRKQIALVIDEYGGTDGLITMEDIVEEIVGEIEDEHDDTDILIQETGEGIFVCDAKAELEDIREIMGDDFSFGEHEEDVDTIGGLIFDITGRIPVRGEVINQNGFEFRVLQADPRRIRRVELLRSGRKRVRRS